MKNKKIDKLIISVSLIVIFTLVACLYLFPDASQETANSIFSSFTTWFGFLGLLLLAGIAISKYGKIKLGEGKPQYSTFKWIAMMLCCGMGSATIYWMFLEWAYYVDTPGLGIEAYTQKAYEFAVTQNIFHWSFIPWSLFALIGLPVAYHFYVRKNKGLSLSSVVSCMTGVKQNGVVGRIIDVLFIFICFGGLSITLGLSLPMITEIFCSVFGIEPTFAMNVVLILAVSVVYSLSSYIGIQKGMAFISNSNSKLTIIFVLGVLILGPTIFIMKNATQAIGLMLQNFVHMALFTDSIGESGFPEAWTIFTWLYWIAYAPFTGIFAAKISKGRTIRSMIINVVVSGSIGCFFMFGVVSSFVLHRQVNDMVDVVGMLVNNQGNEAIVEVLATLPFSKIFAILFCIITILFLATTLDGAAYTMASTSTKNLAQNEDPHPMMRLFWCIMLSLVPLTMILIDANLNTIKTCAVATAVPILFVMIVILFGWLRWLKADYGSKSPAEIEAEAAAKTAAEA